MNIPLPLVEMDHSHITSIHLTTISLSMLVSDMMPPKHLHPLREEMSMQLLVHFFPDIQDFNTIEESHETHFFPDIDTPPDDFYQVHQTKHSRKPPTPLSGFQKDHTRKPTPSAPKKPSKKYDGLVYVPDEVYQLLSPEAVVALKKYNSEAINKMAKKRGIHVNVADVTNHELSIAETNISEEQAIPHQDDDAPEDEADPILDYIKSQHHQEDDMNHSLQAYNIKTSPFSGATPHQSINSVHTHLFHHVAQVKQAQHCSLVDRGANGGLAGSDVRILSKSSRKCPVTGIDQHQINGLDIVQCAALVKTNHGYVNLIMNEYDYYGKGHTIHTSGQIEWNKNQVDDRSVKVGGSQCITTLDGYSFPLKCTGGLMYLSIMGKPTDEELHKYPSVHLTSIHEWDPSVLDYSHPESDGEPLWACDPQHLDLLDPNFDAHGLYTKRAINTLSSHAGVQQPPPMAISSSKSPIQACKHKIKPVIPEFDKYRPYFGWVNADTIRDTFKHTTQWGASVGTFPMKKHLKSRNPALNIPRRHEAVATDTVHSDTPAVDSVVKQAQLFVGKESLVSDIYPMRSGKQFVNTLEDNIHRRGAMDKLISDSD